MSRIVRKYCVYGDSGGSKGFSGGPVISLDYPRTLIGIALGGRGLPKSWPLNDFLIRALNFCGETPRLKILPASTGIHVVYINSSEHLILALSCALLDNVGRREIKRSVTEEETF